MRLCKPPRFFTSLSTIHDVAEPQATNMISSRCAAQPFQKYSKAATKLLRGVSIQGISSKNINFRSLRGFDSMSLRSSMNASSHDASNGAYIEPDASPN